MPVDVRQFGSTVSEFWILKTPDVDTHLNIDEGMDASEAVKDADFVLANGELMGARLKVDPDPPPTPGRYTEIKFAFHHQGIAITGNPAARMTLYAGSTLVQIAQKDVALLTSGHADSQIVFDGFDIDQDDYALLELDINLLLPDSPGEEPPPYLEPTA